MVTVNGKTLLAYKTHQIKKLAKMSLTLLILLMNSKNITEARILSPANISNSKPLDNGSTLNDLSTDLDI